MGGDSRGNLFSPSPPSALGTREGRFWVAGERGGDSSSPTLQLSDVNTQAQHELTARAYHFLLLPLESFPFLSGPPAPGSDKLHSRSACLSPRRWSSCPQHDEHTVYPRLPGQPGASPRLGKEKPLALSPTEKGVERGSLGAVSVGRDK